jgi:hypothetical protein
MSAKFNIVLLIIHFFICELLMFSTKICFNLLVFYYKLFQNVSVKHSPMMEDVILHALSVHSLFPRQFLLATESLTRKDYR